RSAVVERAEAGRGSDDRRPRGEVGRRAERDPERRAEEHRRGQADGPRTWPQPPRLTTSGAAETMRHKKNRNKLSRDAGHRKALVRNLCGQVIQHERVRTTQAKAKVIKPEVEKLIT